MTKRKPFPAIHCPASLSLEGAGFENFDVPRPWQNITGQNKAVQYTCMKTIEEPMIEAMAGETAYRGSSRSKA